MMAYCPFFARAFRPFFRKISASSSASCAMSNHDDTCSAATVTESVAVRYPCLSHHGSSGERSRKLRQSHDGDPARSVMSMTGSVLKNDARSTLGIGFAPFSSDAKTGIHPKLMEIENA